MTIRVHQPKAGKWSGTELNGQAKAGHCKARSGTALSKISWPSGLVSRGKKGAEPINAKLMVRMRVDEDSRNE